jgi:hypothetical protein
VLYSLVTVSNTIPGQPPAPSHENPRTPKVHIKGPREPWSPGICKASMPPGLKLRTGKPPDPQRQPQALLKGQGDV